MFFSFWFYFCRRRFWYHITLKREKGKCYVTSNRVELHLHIEDKWEKQWNKVAINQSVVQLQFYLECKSRTTSMNCLFYCITSTYFFELWAPAEIHIERPVKTFSLILAANNLIRASNRNLQTFLSFYYFIILTNSQIYTRQKRPCCESSVMRMLFLKSLYRAAVTAAVDVII